MRKVLRRLWNAAAILALLAVLAGFIGAVHPAGDSMAVFRLPLTVLAALMVIWTNWRRWVRWPLTLALIGALGGHLWLARPMGEGAHPPHALYQKNLLWIPGDREVLLADIRKSGAVFVTLQEVSDSNNAVLDALRIDFPWQQYCGFARVGGVAVLSKYPMIQGSKTCAERDGLAAMQVETANGPIWLVSLHLHWPWPYEQAAHVGRLVPFLRGLDGPKLIGGDFNAVAWSNTIRRIEQASGTRRIGRHVVTFQLPTIGMWTGIDHVLTNLPGGGVIETRGRLGSDHLGVLAHFHLAP